MSKIKLLYVLSYISENGGVQAVVNNYYSQLKHNKNLQIDFLVLLPGNEEMEKNIMLEGSNVYHLNGSKEKNIFLFVKEIRNFFKEHHDYDVIHSHQTNLDFFYLMEAKKYKIPVRIMHSHSAGTSLGKLRMAITKKLSSFFSNVHFACSKEAGEYYFGNNFTKKGYVFNNAINVDKYTFNEALREKYRKELNIENNFVIGNVARMDENKNQRFLLDLLRSIKDKSNNNIKLLLIGDGPLKEELVEYSKKLNISDDVIFYGVSNKVPELLQAMDLFILPSRYEGVPLTVVEAISSGLPCYISDTIDSHMAENELENKFSLDDNINVLADRIIEYMNGKHERTDTRDIIIKSGFCIKNEASKLLDKYIELLKEAK